MCIRDSYQIQEEKKIKKTTIDKQFEYNTYIRDFFNDNQGKTLQEAILCWKYKKSKTGHHKYEKDDLDVYKRQVLCCISIVVHFIVKSQKALLNKHLWF